MKKLLCYLVLALTFWGCSTLKRQQQQSSNQEKRQVQVSARADSIHWDGRLGNWSFQLATSRYALSLDSSIRKQQLAQSTFDSKQKTFNGYLWQALACIAGLLALFGIIKYVLRHKQS
ncbi:hypothetical protein SAMN05216436_11987 [bacterium A37T11]|nr:hypothetical protein SAMN05216436_11987 [bacterium A37T11]